VRRRSTLDAVGVGPRLVATMVEAAGAEADLLQCEDAVYRPGVLRGYEALFVSGMVTDTPSMIRVLSRWRGGPAVAGGPAFTDAARLLRAGFDYVVWGEGEVSIPHLIKLLEGRIDASEVPNLVRRVGGRVVRNPGPPWAPAPPLWSVDPDARFVRSYPAWWGARIYVEVVRGCSNFFRPTIPLPDGRRCIGCGACRSGGLRERLGCPANIPPGCGYCSVPAIFGPARSRPLEKVVREVRELVRAGVRRVVLSAPDFLDYGRDWLVAPEPLTNPRHPPPNLRVIEELLRRVTEIPEVSAGEAYVMIENVKPNLVTEEVASLLGKYLRGTPVSVGMETGHPAHHAAMGRPSRVEEVFRAVALLRKAGLKPYVYVIHGLPGEDRGVVRATVRAVRRVWRLGAERITLYRFTPLKGSAFEGFPRPPPAVKSVARPLYTLVRRLNYVAKRRLVGREVKAVGVAVSKDGVLIAYTLPHGPVIRVRAGPHAGRLLGKVFTARVVRAVSDRVVEGVAEAAL